MNDFEQENLLSFDIKDSIELNTEELDEVVGGVVPLLFVAAVTAARVAPMVARAAPAIGGAIAKYRDSSIHNTEGKWWSFL